MARIVAVDLFVGRVLRIDGVRHRVTGFGGRRGTTPTVHLMPEGSARVIRMPRAELYALIVEEKAALVDDTEDPECVERMAEVNLSRLSDARLVDWYHKMILLRHLFAHAALSPRSKRFQAAAQEAREILQWVREGSGITSRKDWSDKTLNDDLRRWRRSGYALSAIQAKGLQYRPWRTRKPRYVLASEIARQVRNEYPRISVRNVHRHTRFRLARLLQQAAGESVAIEQSTKERPGNEVCDENSSHPGVPQPIRT